MPIKCKYSADILWVSMVEQAKVREIEGVRGQAGKSKWIILHLRYLVTPHQMQNCVNYCGNKRGEWERWREGKHEMKIVERAMCVHKCKCTERNVSFCICFFDYYFQHFNSLFTNVDRFFSANVISTLSVSNSVSLHLNGWRINHKNEEKFTTFSISWKLSQISFETKLILRNVQATPTKFFLSSLSLTSTVSGLSWLEFTFILRTQREQISVKISRRLFYYCFFFLYFHHQRVLQLMCNSNSIR